MTRHRRHSSLTTFVTWKNRASTPWSRATWNFFGSSTRRTISSSLPRVARFRENDTFAKSNRETCGTLNGKPVLWTSERVSKWPSFDIKPHLSLIRGDGQGTPFQCWHTDSYELKDEVWQAVWSQATAIR